MGGWGRGHCTSGGWTTSYRADGKGKKRNAWSMRETGKDKGGKNMRVDKSVKVKEINAATDESKDKQRR